MRKFYSDCYGKLYDHNGTVGTSDKAPIEYAVEILNEQQRQIESLLNKVAEYYERECNVCKHADYCSPTNHRCGFEKKK